MGSPPSRPRRSPRCPAPRGLSAAACDGVATRALCSTTAHRSSCTVSSPTRGPAQDFIRPPIKKGIWGMVMRVVARLSHLLPSSSYFRAGIDHRYNILLVTYEKIFADPRMRRAQVKSFPCAMGRTGSRVQQGRTTRRVSFAAQEYYLAGSAGRTRPQTGDEFYRTPNANRDPILLFLVTPVTAVTIRFVVLSRSRDHDNGMIGRSQRSDNPWRCHKGVTTVTMVTDGCRLRVARKAGCPTGEPAKKREAV